MHVQDNNSNPSTQKPKTASPDQTNQNQQDVTTSQSNQSAEAQSVVNQSPSTQPATDQTKVQAQNTQSQASVTPSSQEEKDEITAPVSTASVDAANKPSQDISASPAKPAVNPPKLAVNPPKPADTQSAEPVAAKPATEPKVSIQASQDNQTQRDQDLTGTDSITDTATANTASGPATTSQASITKDNYVSSYTPPTGDAGDTGDAGAKTNQSQPTTKADLTPEEKAEAKKLDEDLDKEIARLEQLVKDLETDVVKQEPANSRDSAKPTDSAQKTDSARPVTPPTQSSPPTMSSTSPADVNTTGADSREDDRSDSEKIEDQNIFFLLGIQDSSAEEQDKFLDELQQVVWEDFLESDLPQLVSTEQKQEIDQILQDSSLSDIDKQEQALQKLEGMVTDFEEIMVAKALELKQDLVKDRLVGMKENFAQDQTKLTQVAEAEKQIQQSNWKSGAEILNRLVKGE